MVDIISNINIVNEVMQDVMINIHGKELVARNNFYVGDGYALDIMQVKKNSLKLKIRNEYLENLCTVGIDKKNLIVRYTPEFFFVQNNELISTNLFETNFVLDDLEKAFSENRTAFGYGVEFDFGTMSTTLAMCKIIHDDFLMRIIQ